ncbi:hypothetical protein LOTGIDRAFT_176439 [Lottia gigantea]|uniref:Uncharacterized protein n=1 Tax=Lottia gigantea TaxID=225164 RepID=V4B242_LOTGI|nr:hypothetical protein LOTGIDRAFT_176439 [Lottia gigantea]ESP01686.1 hypothetical protein LOTGIDRAFT_176439 [Lottia gigantea]
MSEFTPNGSTCIFGLCSKFFRRNSLPRSPSPAEDEGRPSKRTRSPSPVKLNTKQKKTDVKEEEITIIGEADQESERDGSKEIRLADGFLTSRKPLKNQTVKKEEYNNYLLESERIYILFNCRIRH